MIFLGTNRINGKKTKKKKKGNLYVYALMYYDRKIIELFKIVLKMMTLYKILCYRVTAHVDFLILFLVFRWKLFGSTLAQVPIHQVHV